MNNQKSDEQSQQTIEFYKTLLRVSNDGILITDSSRNIIEASDAFCSFIGKKRKKIIGSDSIKLLEVFSEDAVNNWKKLKKEVRSKHVASNYEFQLSVKNKIRYFDVNASLFEKTGNGEKGYIISNWHDITDRKQAEELLQESEEKFRNFVETSADLVFRLTKAGLIDYVSPMVEDMYGYHPNELIGKHLRTTTPVGEVLRAIKAINMVLAGKPLTNFEINQKHKLGRIILMEINAVPVYKSGKIVGLQGIMRDITEQKQAEVALQKSESQKKAILDGITTNLAFVNKNLEILWVNKASAISVGKSPEEMIGHKCYEFWADPEKPCDDCPSLKAWKTRKSEHKIINTPDGRVWDECGEPVFDQNGELIGMVEIAKDITEQKRTEEALQESEVKYKNLYSMMRLMSDNLPDLIWTKDAEGKFLFVNKACSEILLDARDIDEPIGKTDMYFADRMMKSHPEITDYLSFGKKCVDSDLTVLKTKKPMRFDESGNVKGKFLFLDVYKAPFDDENGEIIGTVGCARVVTKERQMEKELRESEQKFRDIANLLPQIVYEIDINGNLTFTNKQAFDSFGYSQKEYEKGFNILQTLIPEDRDKAKENIQNILHGKDIRNPEYTALRKDGSTFPILIYSSAIHKDNKPVGLRGIIVDITERKKADEKIRESEERYRELIETSVDGVISIDSQMRIDVWNKGAEKIFGYTREEILGQSIMKIVPERYRKAMEIGFSEFQKSGSGPVLGKTIEIDGIRKDSKEVSIELSVSSRKVSETYIATVIVRNITVRKQAEERFRLISNVTTDLIYEWDVRTDNLVWFGDIDEALGFKPGEIPPTIEGWLKLIHPDDQERISNSLEQHKTSIEPISYVYRIMKKDGSWLYWADRGTPVLNKSGLPVKWIGGCNNITVRKQAEEELKKHREQLEELVKERTAELEEKNNELKRFNKIFINREFRIKELRDKVKEMEKQIK